MGHLQIGCNLLRFPYVSKMRPAACVGTGTALPGRRVRTHSANPGTQDTAPKVAIEEDVPHADCLGLCGNIIRSRIVAYRGGWQKDAHLGFEKFRMLWSECIHLRAIRDLPTPHTPALRRNSISLRLRHLLSLLHSLICMFPAMLR